MHYWTKDLVLDPVDPTQNTWYVGVFSGWGGAPNGKGGLFRTTNRGMSWTKLTGSQFDRVTSLTFNPLNQNQAYLTTETQGLWVSNNMNASIPDWNLVEPYPFRQPERVFFNPYKPSEMWVTSFGNGLKVAQLSTATGEIDFSANDLKVYPNPISEGFLKVELPESKSNSAGNVVVYNVLGGKILEKEMSSVEPALQLDTYSWLPGIYIVKYGPLQARVLKL